MWPPSPERLRNTIDALANALQSAALLSSRLRQQIESDGRDAAALDEAITRAVSALRQLQPETRDE